MTTLDLKKFGFDWKINPEYNFVAPVNYKLLIQTVKIEDDVYNFSNGEKYKKGNFIARGSYGTVFKCKRIKGGETFVMKAIETNNLYGVVKESLIQIIIEHLTKDLKHPEVDLYGPYVPKFIAFGYRVEGVKSFCYIVSEELTHDINTIISKKSDSEIKRGWQSGPESLIKFIPTLFIQIATILDDLNKLVEFNHRDFKSDNTMLSGKQVRLIDFGLSCIKWGEINIDAPRKERFKFCGLIGRDLTQYMYEVYKYFYLPPELNAVFEDLLTFPVNDKPYFIYKNKFDVKSWGNTYNYLNDKSHRNPNGEPTIVKLIWQAFLKNKNYQQYLPYKVGEDLVPMPTKIVVMHEPKPSKIIVMPKRKTRKIPQEKLIKKKKHESI